MTRYWNSVYLGSHCKRAVINYPVTLIFLSKTLEKSDYWIINLLVSGALKECALLSCKFGQSFCVSRI